MNDKGTDGMNEGMNDSMNDNEKKMPNGLLIENFIRNVTYQEADDIFKSFCHEELGLITEWGAIIPNSAKYVLEYDSDGKCYFATIGMLARGEDGAFVQLKHDINEVIDNIPEFSDIFTVKELYKGKKEQEM